jgi:hypothetical protein
MNVIECLEIRISKTLYDVFAIQDGLKLSSFYSFTLGNAFRNIKENNHLIYADYVNSSRKYTKPYLGTKVYLVYK